MSKRLEYFTKEAVQIDNKHMKSGLTSLVIREQKIKTTIR